VSGRTSKLKGKSGELPLLFNRAKNSLAELVLAHGAGAGMRSDYMEFFASELSNRGIDVYRFDFPYMASGRRAPDRAPVLEAAWAEVIESVRDESKPLFVGGKSMGGRIASQAVANGSDVDGLVFLGYPLHAPGRPDKLRVDHFSQISAPMLFVEGTRDPFCPLDTLKRVLKKVRTSTEVVVIDDGDHSFKVRKASGRSTKDAWSEAADAVQTWIEKVVS
jgi:uncharacterized protein